MLRRKARLIFLIASLPIRRSSGLSPWTSSARGKLSSPNSRSEFIRNICIANLSTILTSAFGKSANAACLMGDTSSDCIGVYKVPMDPEISNFVSTPEELAKFAPDIRFVPPVAPPGKGKYNDCSEELIRIYLENIVGNSNGQRNESLRAALIRGDLNDLGALVLGISPRVIVSGRIVLQELLNKSSPSAYRAEVALNDITAGLQQIDGCLLQAIKGQMGGITVAQLSILEDINDVETSYVDLIKVIAPDVAVGNAGTRRRNIKV